MKLPAFLLVPWLILASAGLSLAEQLQVLLKEDFQQPLSPEWFWGLGTWTTHQGVLRGFESGPRRHGPVKMRRFPLTDGVIECEFRLEGKADFAGIIFNGSQERGHIVHLVMAREELRVLAHPEKGQTEELYKQAHTLKPEVWHRARIVLKGSLFTATVDGQTFSVSHPALAEEKQTFGLGGDSGGPEGEKIGALEFRNLTILKN